MQNCQVEGNTVKLPPGQLERKLYLEVAKALELIGGKWKGGKIAGFVFPHDPTELLESIANGEQRNLKKEYQYFATPPKIARMLVECAYLEMGQRILEPSAGQGAILEAIKELHPFTRQVSCCELMEVNRIFLEKIPGANILTDDFLQLGPEYNNHFHRIIANPPFSKNQDIDHIYKMYECLKPGGKLVTIASKHWTFASEKKCVEFREWLESKDAVVADIEAGEFSESGTNVATVYLRIDKAA